MRKSIVNPYTVKTLLSDLDKAFERKGKMFLTGETAFVMEGWRAWTTQIEITGMWKSHGPLMNHRFSLF